MNDNCRGLVRLINEYSSVSGSTGPTGDQGPIGLVGIRGPTGIEPRGDRGDRGDTGPQGGIGPIGDPGPIGPQGDTGSIYDLESTPCANQSQINIQLSEIEDISINVHPRDLGWLSRTNVYDYRGLGSTDWQSNSVLIGDYSGISSGLDNINNSSESNVSGGVENVVSEGRYNSTTGGQSNTISISDGNLIGGGISNTVVNESMILGGTSNRSVDNSTILGGTENLMAGGHVTIVGGYSNISRHYINYEVHRPTIWGGNNNSATIIYPTVMGGWDNGVSCGYSNILGGSGNHSGNLSSITRSISLGGGQYNYISGGYGIIGGGESNTCNYGRYNIIGGGYQNRFFQYNTRTNSIVFGGSQLRPYANMLTMFGGQDNLSAIDHSSTIGGIHNIATLTLASLGMLYINTIGGQGLRPQRIYSILTGLWNTHLGDYDKNDVINDAILTVGRGTGSNDRRSILCLTSEGDLHIAGSHQSGTGNDYSETFWSETDIQPGTPVVMNSNGLVSEYTNEDPELIIGVVSVMSAIVVNSEGKGTLVRRDSSMRPIEKSSDIIQPNNRHKIIVGMIGQVYVRDQYLTRLPTRWRILHESSKLCDGMTLALIR